MADTGTEVQLKKLKRWKAFALLVILLMVLTSAYLATRFLTDRAVVHDDIEAHFKYGSIGGERNLGIPYWIWQVCAQSLP